MERLQAAINKARLQRGETPAPTPAAPRPDSPRPVPAPAPDAGAWEALPEIQLRPQRMPRNRMIAYTASPESAPYDMLRTRMLQQAKTHNWKRVAIVSPNSNCGKSTTAANLVFSLSRQTDLRSMVLDFDLRRGGLTKLFEQHLPYGMADVLEGRVPFKDHGRRYGPNVGLGFTKGAVRRAAEILQSSQTKEVLSGIEEAYAPDITLFDMPPLMASDDNFGFLQNVDCALIMVAAEHTSMTQIDLAERQVAELTNVLGIVLNKCRHMGGAHGHEYDYY